MNAMAIFTQVSYLEVVQDMEACLPTYEGHEHQMVYQEYAAVHRSPPLHSRSEDAGIADALACLKQEIIPLDMFTWSEYTEEGKHGQVMKQLLLSYTSGLGLLPKSHNEAVIKGLIAFEIRSDTFYVIKLQVYCIPTIAIINMYQRNYV